MEVRSIRRGEFSSPSPHLDQSQVEECHPSRPHPPNPSEGRLQDRFRIHSNRSIVETRNVVRFSLFPFQTHLFDRLIFLRCSADLFRSNEGKFDQIADNLCFSTMRKCFFCLLAKDSSSSSSSSFGLIVVEEEKVNWAENLLREKNFDQLIFDEQRSSVPSAASRNESEQILNEDFATKTKKNFFRLSLPEGSLVSPLLPLSLVAMD